MVPRRCCSSSGPWLKKQRADKACEMGFRRLAATPQSGGCGRRAAIVPRRGGASVPQTNTNQPTNNKQNNYYQQQQTTKTIDQTELVVLWLRSAALLPWPARSGCHRTRWRLRGMSTPCRKAAWAEAPTLLGSSSYGCLARLLGPKLSRNDAQPVLLGRVGKGAGRCSRWLHEF